MEKKWIINDSLSADQSNFKQQIISHFKCPELIAELLLKKKFTSIEEIDLFFRPQPEQMHDPFLFHDMSKAIDRILLAIDRQEKITIYGDYDVDGTTATSLLYLGMKRLHAIIDYYIPHRMIDGYGISMNGLNQLWEEKTTLVISVDCGINALEEIDAMNRQGMDIIITDHHNPKEILPKALAIINPKVPDCGYPFPYLAGVGVAYKLLMALYKRMGIDTMENIYKYLDLVALGTIADIVPLVGENRVFASIGLQHLIQKKNLGLNALVNISNLNQKELDATDIVFGLAPRINAAGRMESATLAVELMISVDETRSAELAEGIERQNSLRQQEDQKTFYQACEIIDKKYKNLDDAYCMVVSSDGWHPGVIGIVASKLVEKYYRPVIMISFKDGIGSGSGRSIADFDLFGALTQVENNLHSFGGHKYAVGLTIYEEYLDRFENELNRFVKQHLSLEQMLPPISIDKEIELYNISDELMSWISKFAPFGPENARPVFETRNVVISNYPYNVGRNHLKLKVMKDGVSLDMIGYNLGDYLSMLRKNAIVDIAYTLEMNTF
ncbi:MAG TPA: single-stranded-DNA-specific exonuclease RecJ, partial [Candidatus Cloacimonadota bacterium]|nr:single-stranded-DNA-specific exonuclease RecJ [Candidatus Cloacimonadota bacterium]